MSFVSVVSDVPRIRLRCSKPAVNVTPILLDAKVSDGVGGWAPVTRPRQTSMTVWSGNPPYTLALHVMFDEYTPLRIQLGATIEDRIGRVLLAGRGDNEAEPSTWRIDGIPMQLDVTDWVLNTAEAGDKVIRRPGDFQRVRQEYTLTFLEYVPPEYVKLRARALAGAKPPPTTLYHVKRGDTPAGIARKRNIKWTVIRGLNVKTVHAANQKLKPGSRLRVPVLKVPAKKKHR